MAGCFLPLKGYLFAPHKQIKHKYDDDDDDVGISEKVLLFCLLIEKYK